MLKQRDLVVHGFTGMYDSLEPRGDQTKAFMLLNCNIEMGSAVTRMGFQIASATSIGTGTAFAGLVHEWSKLDGTLVRTVVSGGEIWVLSTSGVPTRYITTANLTTASITLDANNPCYCVAFNNQLVISDGINKPFMWDGTSGSGLTSLTNAPVAFGPPTVYYAKLFFIKSTDRGTIVWSEENAANTGYEAGGYNNAWTLGQTGSDALYAILGTNEGLYYWRTSSIGLIRGAVTSTFNTTGTHDAVSDRVGHNALAGVVNSSNYRAFPKLFNGHIYFADQRGRAHRLVLGGGVEDLSRWVPRRTLAFGSSTFTSLPMGKPFNLGEEASTTTYPMNIVTWPSYGRVLFVYNNPSCAALVFDADTGNCLGIYQWATGVITDCFAAAIADSTQPTTSGLFGKGRANVVKMVPGNSIPYGTDASSTASATYTSAVIGPAQGYGEGIEWKFNEIEVVYETNSVDSGALITVDYLTDQVNYSTEIAAAQTASAYDANFPMKEQRARFGINGYGSWIRVRVQMSGQGRVAVKGWKVKAFVLSDTAVVVP